MKLFIATLLMAASVFATDTTTTVTLPASLGKTMKAMSTNLKAIASNVDNKKENANSALLADDFVTLTLHSKTFTPESISELPKEHQVKAKTEYDRDLDATADLGKQLAAAFRANDNALAATLLDRLSDAKHDGHKKFK